MWWLKAHSCMQRKTSHLCSASPTSCETAGLQRCVLNIGAHSHTQHVPPQQSCSVTAQDMLGDRTKYPKDENHPLLGPDCPWKKSLWGIKLIKRRWSRLQTQIKAVFWTAGSNFHYIKIVKYLLHGKSWSTAKLIHWDLFLCDKIILKSHTHLCLAGTHGLIFLPV